MVTYKQLRDKFDKDVKKLQKECPHKKTTDWVDKWWAPGHSCGFKVKICLRCNKEVEQYPSKKEREKNREKFRKEFIKEGVIKG